MPREFTRLLVVVLALTFCRSGAVSQEYIRLPEPRVPASLETCIAQRRSVRDFTAAELTLHQVSTLLWAAQGITDTLRSRRAAPSAGATYPLEVYLCRADGIFHYEPAGHRLKPISSGDPRPALRDAASGQDFIASAPVDIVICAVPARTETRYGARTMRYVWMEVGHAAQNIHLAAVGLGLGSVPVGAFDDDAVGRILGLAAGEIPCYIIPVGQPRGREP